MKVGWLVDWTTHTGGAELTQQEFRDAAPDGVEIIDCPAGEEWPDCDRYVIQNCVRYSAEELKALEGKPVVKYWHDVGPWVGEGVREWIDAHATSICCSPVQSEYMEISDAIHIPPPIDLSLFEEAASRVNGDRSGTVSIGSWRNHGKAPHKAAEWAQQKGVTVDFFGGGAWAPHGSREVPYEHIAGLLASYETFVFLPSVLEPFGRLVAEAWAAGCELVVNDLVGARYWIEERPEALETAAEDFWKVVLGEVPSHPQGVTP